MALDAQTVTREQMLAMAQPELREIIVPLMQAYAAGKDATTQIGDVTRLELYREFYNRAYGLDDLVLPYSHADALEGLKDGKPVAGFSIG